MSELPSKQRMLTQSNRVVKAIYTQDSRYVYELIQNADDVSYTSTFEPPSLTFTLDHEKLTIDTNEDGFTAANVKAVCSVNESSKKLSEEDDSIGEKGIGFKSVFNVAQSVRIQSGLWSFQFNNDPNDALSMFIPVPVAQQVLDEGVRTRITLRYHHGKTKEIADALAALHDNTIAFLRRIVKLKIIYRLSDVSWSSTLSRELTKTYDENHHMLTLKSVTRVQHRGNQSQEKHYRLFKQTFKDMPADDRRRRRTAEVQLAFPVDPETQTPQISEEGEDIFAFLPMMRRREIPVSPLTERLMFLSNLIPSQFIIQSDFITLINRESVVSCQWNTKLRENIAKAFTDAMIQLAVNDKQHYEWLEYLPRSPIDGFWEPLPSLIFDTIKSQNLLKPYAEEELRPATDLSILPDSFLHEGTPLLDDTELFETCYLSPEYIERGFGTQLRSLGMRNLTWTKIVDRLQADLEEQISKLRTKALDDPWHISFAGLIEEASTMPNPSCTGSSVGAWYACSWRTTIYLLPTCGLTLRRRYSM